MERQVHVLRERDAPARRRDPLPEHRPAEPWLAAAFAARTARHYMLIHVALPLLRGPTSAIPPCAALRCHRTSAATGANHIRPAEAQPAQPARTARARETARPRHCDPGPYNRPPSILTTDPGNRPPSMVDSLASARV